VNACPTLALTQAEDLTAGPPQRKITLSYDTCIFCGNCHDTCTTQKGITLSNKWDLATLDRQQTRETHSFELQLCEKCGAVIGTKKHIVWLYEKLGPLAYTNPSILLAAGGQLLSGHQELQAQQAASPVDKDTTPVPDASDFMRILCPQCKFELNVRV
jgi:ferredoxin